MKIMIELSEKVVRKIEKAAEEDIKTLLEREISEQNGEVFIELLGLDNW